MRELRSQQGERERRELEENYSPFFWMFAHNLIYNKYSRYFMNLTLYLDGAFYFIEGKRYPRYFSEYLSEYKNYIINYIIL